jgi:outer membrane protein assembly factor BamB
MGQPTGWAPAEPLIELGEMADELPSDRDDGPIRPPRWLAIAFVAVLTAAGLVSDTARAWLRPVFTTASAPTDFDVSGDVLYAFDGSLSPNRVSAYRLTDGKRLWGLQSPSTTSYERVIQVGGRTLLVPNPCIASSPVMTVAVDTATGRQVWRQRGIPERPVSGGRLVLMSRPGPTFGCGTVYNPGDTAPAYWDAVDVTTGAVIWSVEVPGSARISFDSYGDAGSRWVVFVARDGTVTSRDLVTGAVTGQIRLPELALADQPPSDLGPAGTPNLMVVGNQAMVVRRIVAKNDEQPAVLDITAYDLATLARRWNARSDAGPSDLRFGFEYLNLAGCGPVLCLYGSDWTVFLDPRDGAERWRTELSLLAISGGRALFGDPQATGGQSPIGGLTVRDIRTGEIRGDLAGWRVLTGDPSRAAVTLLGFTADDRTWFGRLDLDRARVSGVGFTPGWYGSCVTQPRYVACRRLDGSVRAWRTPGT